MVAVVRMAAAAAALLLVPLAEHILRGQLLRLVGPEVGVLGRDNAVQRLQARGEIELGCLDG